MSATAAAGGGAASTYVRVGDVFALMKEKFKQAERCAQTSRGLSYLTADPNAKGISGCFGVSGTNTVTPLVIVYSRSAFGTVSAAEVTRAQGVTSKGTPFTVCGPAALVEDLVRAVISVCSHLPIAEGAVISAVVPPANYPAKYDDRSYEMALYCAVYGVSPVWCSGKVSVAASERWVLEGLEAKVAAATELKSNLFVMLDQLPQKTPAFTTLGQEGLVDGKGNTLVAVASIGILFYQTILSGLIADARQGQVARETIGIKTKEIRSRAAEDPVSVAKDFQVGLTGYARGIAEKLISGGKPAVRIEAARKVADASENFNYLDLASTKELVDLLEKTPDGWTKPEPWHTATFTGFVDRALANARKLVSTHNVDLIGAATNSFKAAIDAWISNHVVPPMAKSTEKSAPASAAFADTAFTFFKKK